jgi:hypothetical protein
MGFIQSPLYLYELWILTLNSQSNPLGQNTYSYVDEESKMNRTDTSTINTGPEWITLRNRGTTSYEELSNDFKDDSPSAFEEEISLYAYWSTEELHNLARELEIPNYQHINREALIEMMIRRLF